MRHTSVQLFKLLNEAMPVDVYAANRSRGRGMSTMQFDYPPGIDQRPRILYLGTWTDLSNLNIKVQGLNLNYLKSPAELEELRAILPDLKRRTNGKTRYRYAAAMLPHIIVHGGPGLKKKNNKIRATRPHGIYRTYNIDDVGSITNDLMSYYGPSGPPEVDDTGKIVSKKREDFFTQVPPPTPHIPIEAPPAPPTRPEVPSAAPKIPEAPIPAPAPEAPVPAPEAPISAPAPTSVQRRAGAELPPVPVKPSAKPVMTGKPRPGVKAAPPQKLASKDDKLAPDTGTSIQVKRNKSHTNPVSGIDIGDVKDEDKPQK